MEIYPQAAELEGRRGKNICAYPVTLKRCDLKVMTQGQGHDTSWEVGYKEYLFKSLMEIHRQMNYKAVGKMICVYRWPWSEKYDLGSKVMTNL